MLAVERCHIEVDAIVATPYASALACLIDDEADMGAVVIDFGAGSTSIAVLEGGKLVHVDAVAVGGHHITTDLARGLSMRISDAERIKAQHGVLSASAADERDLITIPQVDEGEHDTRATLPRAAITRIIRPRAEEILEVARDRLTAAGIVPKAGRRLVFTGGACQLAGLAELARSVIGAPARLGRPLGVKGLPEAAKGPAYSAAVGLIIYPQIAEADRIEIRNPGTLRRTGTDGYLARVSRWLRDSF
jgi:cell division protein FtsA